MDKFKFYRRDNYIILANDFTKESFYGFVKEVHVDKDQLNRPYYRFFNIKGWNNEHPLLISQLLKEDSSPYEQAEFETFYTQNTGNFNGGSGSPGVQSVTGSSVDNTDPQNPVINAIEEAPVDGNQYGRQNGDWTQITGSGSTPTLDQVVLTGNTASKDFYYENVMTESGIIQETKEGIWGYAGSPTSLTDYPFIGTKQDFTGAVTEHSYLGFHIGVGGGAAIYQNISNPSANAETLFTLPRDIDPMGNTFGTAELAVRSDTTLQKVLENDGIAELTSPNESHILNVQMLVDDSGSLFVAESSNDSLNLLSRLELSDGKVFISQHGNTTLVGRTELSFETPISDYGSVANIKIPAKPEGDYILATTEDIDAGVKIYTATADDQTDTGTANPSINILKNTIGDIVWTRITTGLFFGTLAGAFPAGKTHLSITPSSPTGSYSIFRNTDDVIVIKTQDNGTMPFTDADGKLFNNSFRIEVYD